MKRSQCTCFNDSKRGLFPFCLLFDIFPFHLLTHSHFVYWGSFHSYARSKWWYEPISYILYGKHGNQAKQPSVDPDHFRKLIWHYPVGVPVIIPHLICIESIDNILYSAPARISGQRGTGKGTFLCGHIRMRAPCVM